MSASGSGGVEALFREGMDFEARRLAAGALYRVTGVPFDAGEDRAKGAAPLPPLGEEWLGLLPPLGTRFFSIHDRTGDLHRLVLFFPAASGQLRKRLRSPGARESLAPLFLREAASPDSSAFEWFYRQEEGDVAVVALYSACAGADELGDRVLGLRDALAKVDKKSLERWVGKFLSSAGSTAP